jgi:cytochrome c2
MPSRPRLYILIAAVALVCIGGAAAGGYYAKQQSRSMERAIALTGGDPKKAPDLILQFGCAGCHQISGIRGPSGKIGPPLDNVASRVYLAGRIANTPSSLINWIADPRSVDPATAMPTTGITREQARDVAAYLLSRR